MPAGATSRARKRPTCSRRSACRSLPPTHGRWSGGELVSVRVSDGRRRGRARVPDDGSGDRVGAAVGSGDAGAGPGRVGRDGGGHRRLRPARRAGGVVLDQVLAVVLSAMSLTAMELIGRKKWQGWALGLVNQGLWFYLTVVVAGLWGLGIQFVIFAVIYTRHLVRWKRESGRAERKGTTC